MAGKASIKYPATWYPYDCGDGRYAAGEHTWWVGTSNPGGCLAADAFPGPIEITVAAQLRPADTDTSGCGGAIVQTQVAVDGVSGTRYEEGQCTTTISYLGKSPDIYYVFGAPGAQFLFDYHKIGNEDLTATFETMVEQGLHFAR